MPDENRRFIAYEIHGRSDMELTTAPLGRDWMDHSPERFAYRCLPLTIANQAGWLIHSPATFTARWDGGSYSPNVHVEFEPPGTAAATDPWNFTVDSAAVSAMAAARDERISSHFGVGVITFSLPYLFRTPPGINLWVKGPTNWIKDGVQALEGIIETDWSPATFTMNWKLTRPHNTVRFEKGEPICMLIPVARGLAEGLEPVQLPLHSNSELQRDFEAWGKSRAAFGTALKSRQPDAVRRGWQRDYTLGLTPDGARVSEHQTRLDLREFVRGESDTDQK